MPDANSSGTPIAPRTAKNTATATSASAISSPHERSYFRAGAFAPSRCFAMNAGLPKPTCSACSGHALTQSRHFMQPWSTTILKSRTSSWTRTFEVHTAVQWPHCVHASDTRMRTGESSSSGAKKPPYGQP